MKPTILCVDDEQIVRTSLKEQLKRFFDGEYRIEIADSGEVALELVLEIESEGGRAGGVLRDALGQWQRVQFALKMKQGRLEDAFRLIEGVVREERPACERRGHAEECAGKSHGVAGLHARDCSRFPP